MESQPKDPHYEAQLLYQNFLHISTRFFERRTKCKKTLILSQMEISESTLRHGSPEGSIPPHVKTGGSVRFREKAAMEWLLQRERERKRKNVEAWEKYLT